MSKRGSCVDKDNCQYEWEVTDHGCGVIVKSNNKKYWTHKAPFIGFPLYLIPIDAAAVNYAATNDGKSLIFHLKRINQHVPFVTDKVDRVIADGPFTKKTNLLQFIICILSKK
ncbi:MAG: hypothetical protein JSW07_07920 [bacterium]|nr:MAG: hypothetical protein JSW07_07920 [bacterium]